MDTSKVLVTLPWLMICIHYTLACSSNSRYPTVIRLSSFSDTKYIKTPNYPHDYPTFKTCYWKVEANWGKRISYRFADDFALKTTSGFGSCSFEYVKLYDSERERDRIGEYCGYSTPPAGTTTGRYLFIKFKSFSGDNKGFKLGVTEGTVPPFVDPDYPDYSSGGSVVGLIIGVIFLIIVVIGIIICVSVCCCCMKGGSRQGTVVGRFGGGRSNPAVVTSGTQPAAYPQAPPAQAYPTGPQAYQGAPAGQQGYQAAPYPVQHYAPPPQPYGAGQAPYPPAYSADAPPAYGAHAAAQPPPYGAAPNQYGAQYGADFGGQASTPNYDPLPSSQKY